MPKVFIENFLKKSDCSYVLAGESAFIENGLTTLCMEDIQCWTLIPDMCMRVRPIAWYSSPFADDFRYTEPSTMYSNLYVPSAERALVEYMIFSNYFDEGILIEGLQTYRVYDHGKLESLLDMGKEFYCRPDVIEYWWKEAREAPRH